MGFADKLQESIGAATAASERMLQAAKLKNQVATLRQQQQTRVLELGEQAHHAVRSGEITHAGIVAASNAIGEIDTQVVELERQISELQAASASPGGSVCGGCGQFVPEQSKFCPACGAEAQKPDPAQVTGSFQTCSNCKSPLDEGAKFCTVCGAAQVSPTSD